MLVEESKGRYLIIFAFKGTCNCPKLFVHNILREQGLRTRERERERKREGERERERK